MPSPTAIGLHTIRVATKHGVSNLRPFVVDEVNGIAEVETNRTKDTAQAVEAPCSISGRTDPEASDYFKVKVAAGQKLTFEVLARRIGSPLDPIVYLRTTCDDETTQAQCGAQSGTKVVSTAPVEERRTTMNVLVPLPGLPPPAARIVPSG